MSGTVASPKEFGFKMEWLPRMIFGAHWTPAYWPIVVTFTHPQWFGLHPAVGICTRTPTGAPRWTEPEETLLAGIAADLIEVPEGGAWRVVPFTPLPGQSPMRI
jgi:hypothetical protein